jgi:hypothetical protein
MYILSYKYILIIFNLSTPADLKQFKWPKDGGVNT